jgi:hypothetical protein
MTFFSSTNPVAFLRLTAHSHYRASDLAGWVTPGWAETVGVWHIDGSRFARVCFNYRWLLELPFRQAQARDGDHPPLAEEVRNLLAERPNINAHIAYSRPRPEDEYGSYYHSEGRVTGQLLETLVQDVDAHYFLCGPTQFMADIQAALEQQNVPAEQIHYESFGPSA